MKHDEVCHLDPFWIHFGCILDAFIMSWDVFGWIWMHFAHVTGLQLVNVDEAAADAKYQKLCSEVDVLAMVQTGLIRLFLCMHVVSCCF